MTINTKKAFSTRHSSGTAARRKVREGVGRGNARIDEDAVFNALGEANELSIMINQLARLGQGNADVHVAILGSIEMLSSVLCRHLDIAHAEVIGGPGFGTFADYFSRLANPRASKVSSPGP